MPDDSDCKVKAAGPQTEDQNLYKHYINSKLVPVSFGQPQKKNLNLRLKIYYTHNSLRSFNQQFSLLMTTILNSSLKLT